MSKESYFVVWKEDNIESDYKLEELPSLAKARQLVTRLTKDGSYIEKSAKVIAGFSLQIT